MDYSSFFKNFASLKESDLPYYLKLYEFLKEKILNKELTKLPSERELSKILNVSRLTITKVYEKLKNDGLIYSKKGSGYFINFDSLYFVQSRKERAYLLINSLIDTLLKENFNFTDIKNLFNSILSFKELNSEEINVAFIDCNPESFFIINKQLKELFKINLFFYPVINFHKEKIEDFLNKLKNNFDFIITTKKHFKEILSLCKNEHCSNLNIIKVSIEPDSETIFYLSKITKNSKKLILTYSTRFSEIIKDYLIKFDLEINSEYSILDNFFSDYKNFDSIKKLDDKDLENFIQKKFNNLNNFDFIIMPQNFDIVSYYKFLKHNKINVAEYGENTLNIFNSFIKNFSNKIIYFNYKIDNGSLILIEDKINEINKNKLKDYIKEGVLNEKN